MKEERRDADHDLEGCVEVIGALEALDECLKNPQQLKWKVEQLFRKHASPAEDLDGRMVLDVAQAREMSKALAAKLRLPAWLFQDLDHLFERFDFDGHGRLSREECVKMYRKGLAQRRTEIGGQKHPVAVPEKTLDGAGYTVIQELGRGGQGIMYLCSSKSCLSGRACPLRCESGMLSHGSDRFCVKFYDKENANACNLDELIAEYTLLKELNHRHVAKTHEVFQDHSFYYLVIEPYFGGDLTKLGKRAHEKGVEMSENWWRSIFRQVFAGLIYLHKRAVIHCDIKEENIMIAQNDSYLEPRPVLIDFGLATSFGSLDPCRAADHLGGPGCPAGTPGYIPPETWETEVWYPVGDIFSLGVVIFQLMSGRIPSQSGKGVRGVLQEGGDAKAYAKDARSRPLPWTKFPPDMPQLRNLIEKMTSRDRHLRLRASQAVAHEWFASASDALLPAETIRDLVCGSEGHSVRKRVLKQLLLMNNLEDIRALQRESCNLACPGNAGFANNEVVKLLRSYGVDEKAGQKLVATCGGPDGRARLLTTIDDAVAAKEGYCHQLIKDLFDELDVDQSGALSPQKLRMLVTNDAFECPFTDVDQVMAYMDTNQDGIVSFEEFKKAVLQDGRIGRRADGAVGGGAGAGGEGCAAM